MIRQYIIPPLLSLLALTSALSNNLAHRAAAQGTACATGQQCGNDCIPLDNICCYEQAATYSYFACPATFACGHSMECRPSNPAESPQTGSPLCNEPLRTCGSHCLTAEETCCEDGVSSCPAGLVCVGPPLQCVAASGGEQEASEEALPSASVVTQAVSPVPPAPYSKTETPHPPPAAKPYTEIRSPQTLEDIPTPPPVASYSDDGGPVQEPSSPIDPEPTTPEPAGPTEPVEPTEKPADGDRISPVLVSPTTRTTSYYPTSASLRSPSPSPSPTDGESQEDSEAEDAGLVTGPWMPQVLVWVCLAMVVLG